MANKLTKKQLLLAGGFLIVIFALVLVALKQEAPYQQQLTGLQIAELSTQNLDSMRLPDSTYFLNKQCDGHMYDSLPQSNSWALMAYAALLQATGSQQHLDSVNNEITVIEQLSGDITTFPSFSMTTIQIYEGHKAIIGKDQAKEQFLLNFIVSFADSLASISDPSVLGSAMLLSIGSRELAIAYSVTERGDYNTEETGLSGKFLQESKQYLDLAEQQLEKDEPWVTLNGQDLKGDTCWVQLAQLELHKATGEDLYLAKTRDYFDQMDITEAALEVDTTARELMPVILQPCAESLLILYRETSEEKYLSQAIEILNYIIETKWDSDYNKRCTADNGFLISSSRKHKVHTDTSYQIYLMSQPEIANKQFTIK